VAEFDVVDVEFLIDSWQPNLVFPQCSTEFHAWLEVIIQELGIL